MRPSLAALTLGVAALASPALARATEPPAGGASAPSPAPGLELTTLRALLERGVISQLEYDAAMRDLAPSTGEQRAGDAVSLAFGRWATTLYGFLEGDFIYDTTQSFNDLAGNAQVQRPDGHAAPPPASQETYAGSHGQTQFSIRNSRLGLRLKPPGTETVRTSGMLEMDFLGAQTAGYSAGQVSENTFVTSPVMRLRHAMFRVETPIVDVLVGQYWHLFGWQGVYSPNTVEIQGVPGELYARTPQIRVSHTFKAHPVTVDVALGAMKPPSRGSELPEAVGGVRVAVDEWTGMQTVGATGTSIMPASVAITADYRRFEVPGIDSLVPTSTVSTSATSVAADAFVPVLPASKDHRDNALSLTGEIVYGAGIADLYSGLNGGMQFPYVPNTMVTNPTGLNPAPVWPQNMDPGLVNYDLTGFALHPIQWTSYLVGLQYYLPAMDGKVWLSANYSRMQSRDSSLLGSASATSDFARQGGVNPMNYYFQTSPAQVRSSEDWFDVNVFVQPLPAVRIGVELAEFIDHYADGFAATNYRGQASGFFLF